MREEDRCKAWVGLDPPGAVDCELHDGHFVFHQGVTLGSVRLPDNSYQTITVLVSWGHTGE